MNFDQRQRLTEAVRFFYDLQRLRIAAKARAQPTADPVKLDQPGKINLLDRGIYIEEAEKVVLESILGILQTIPFYTDVLSRKPDYKGLGPQMAAIILSEFDINKAVRPSQFWSFAGLTNSDCKRCCTCHQIISDMKDGKFVHPKNFKGNKCEFNQQELRFDQVYDSTKAKKPVKGQKIPYNKWLRTKLIGVLGPSLIKTGSPWAQLYYNKKKYYQDKNWGTSDGHRHNAAIRFMIKQLLLDIWTKWRTSEGLPVVGSYHKDKLGHVHHGDAIVVGSPVSVTESALPIPPKEESESLNQI
jgi:hypothetical protein